MRVSKCSTSQSTGKPFWLRRSLSYTQEFFSTKKVLDKLQLNTVCREALCPNVGDCWTRGEATFIILGKNCTRNCLFCNVDNNKPELIDVSEPRRIAEAVKRLNLDYVVITSVTRDDLKDYGTNHFLEVVRVIKNFCIVELLIPDMLGDVSFLNKVALSGASVIGHNIETVDNLYSKLRPKADYRRSLSVLKQLSEYKGMITKSALMVGLGESWSEIIDTLIDLKNVGVDIVYIGQYLRPSEKHYSVYKFYTPEEFKSLEDIARDMGFSAVCAGPYSRSSYNAKSLYHKAFELSRFDLDNHGGNLLKR